MKALITGAEGQVGRALLLERPGGWEAVGHGVTTLDITAPRMVDDVLERERPNVVIHAAAYTAVDAAETDQARAQAVNADGTRHLARAARRYGARMIYISTDFVYDGGQGRPYRPADPPSPLSAYGRTKLAGETAVMEECGDQAVVVRTAWVYSDSGKNFVLTMLRLMRERDEVRVVGDQMGSPTWSVSLAQALWVAAARPNVHGIHHWTDAGVASWYDFALAIQEEALALGLLTRAVPVRPIRTAEYPTPAHRPPYSVLDKSDTWAALDRTAEHWRTNLRHMLQGLARA